MSSKFVGTIGGLLLVACACGVFLLSCAKKADQALVPVEYENWSRTTKIELNYPIPGHEDNYREIYINDVGLGVAIRREAGKAVYDYPEGTIILKEVFQGLEHVEGSKPTMLTVMIKNRENPKSRGGWLWVVKDMASGKESIISQEFCITCHENANEGHPYGDRNPNEDFRDYVFFPVK